MAKRTRYESNRKRVKVEEEPKKAYIPKTVQVRLLKEMKLKIRGTSTGKWYLFERAGFVLSVDKKDLPALLAKGTDSSCCGGNESPYFEEVLGG
jgi:hypothetical protein